MTVKTLREVQRASAATIAEWVPFEMQLGELTVTVTVKGAEITIPVRVETVYDSQLTVIKDTCDEILGKVDSLIDSQAKTGVVTGSAIRKPERFAGSLSKAAQAHGHMPDNSPLGRMFRAQEDKT